MTHHSSAYQKRFKQYTSCSFNERAPGITIVSIKNAAATSEVSLYAAHILSYTPQAAEDVLWLSTSAYYKNGEAIRGGIPLCWPWFGPAKDTALPAHGFARLTQWELSSINEVSDRQTDLILTLSDSDESRRYWPHAFHLEYHISVAETLTCSLRTTNTGSEAFTISQALHSYFACNAAEARIYGLENTPFTSDMQRGNSSSAEAIQYDGEIDRVYHDTTATCSIEDNSAKRAIHIAKEHSRTTVIWNPGPDIALAKADFDNDGYKKMFCVETCNIDADAREIAPGAEHAITAIISLTTL